MHGDERLTAGDWCAVRCSIDGHPVTVLVIAHPSNPRPARWFTMSKPFCYLATALNLDKEPVNLPKGERWNLRYSIAMLSTPADHARLANLAATWKTLNPFPAQEKSNPAKP